MDEIKELWFRDKAYEMKKPTIDRINSNEHYEYSNCRFIEKALNSSLAHYKKVAQFTLDNKLLKIWNSLNEIALAFGVTHSTISHSIKKGKYRGFLWKKLL